MSDPETPLLQYLAASVEARTLLSQLKGIAISGEDVQAALCEVLELNELETIQLIELDLSAPRIVELLNAYDFRKLHPEVLAVFELEHSILPPGVSDFLCVRRFSSKVSISEPA